MMILALIRKKEGDDLTPVIQSGLSVESIAEAILYKHCTDPKQIEVMYQLDFDTVPSVTIPIFRYVHQGDVAQWYVPHKPNDEIRSHLNQSNIYRPHTRDVFATPLTHEEKCMITVECMLSYDVPVTRAQLEQLFYARTESGMATRYREYSLSDITWAILGLLSRKRVRITDDNKLVLSR